MKDSPPSGLPVRSCFSKALPSSLPRSSSRSDGHRVSLIVANLLLDGPTNYDHNTGQLITDGGTMQVSIRELKAHLSQYLSQAQAGQSLEITSHRKPVARIVGVPAKSDKGLARLLAGGAATWEGGKPIGATLHLSARGTPISQIVIEDRG